MDNQYRKKQLSRAENIYRKKTEPREARDKETTEMDKNNMTAGSKEQINETQEQATTEKKKVNVAEADPNDEWVKKYKEEFGSAPSFF